MFTYDRKNRLKSSRSVGQSLDANHLWYDGMGRIWQRWIYTGMAWESTLTRFVYDGSQMVQEHTIDVEESEGEWVYTYDDLTRDYLRHPAGTRQRERSGAGDKDYYLQTSGSAIEYKTERGLTASTTWRSEHTPSLDKMTGATFENISNLATSGNFIEMYGGGTSDADTKGFDPLLQSGGRHYLAGLGRYLSRQGNNSYRGDPGGGMPGDFPPDDPFLPPERAPLPGIGWRGSGVTNQNKKGPRLPQPDSCCQDYYNDFPCLKAKHTAGWFEFCCNNDCWDLVLSGNILGEPCGPCSCDSDTCGHNCTSTHCEWSFGFNGSCGADIILAVPKFTNCNYQEMIAIIDAFKVACEAAKRCACQTYHDEDMKQWLDEDAAWGIDWMDVWGCIAEICRTGNIHFICHSDSDRLGWTKANFFGYVWHVYMHLDIDEHKKHPPYDSLANTILHEMLHRCGVGNLGKETRDYATYRIADRCIAQEETCTGQDDILADPAPWDNWPKHPWE